MKIAGWKLHGETAETKLLAGIFPTRGVHMLTGPDAAANMALAADLAVAIAAGDVGCGLGLPDAGGSRTSLAGFFGQRVGEPGGVAILAQDRATMVSAVEAAALVRGVTSPLPIAIAETNGELRALTDGTCAVHRVRDGLARQLRLLIIEAGATATAVQRDAVRGAALAAESVGGCAVLVVAQCGPAGLADAGGVVLEATSVSLALAQAHEGAAGWTRAFKTQRILLAGGGEALAIQPGAILPHTPKWKAAAPTAAPAPVEKTEPKIIGRYVAFITGRPIEPHELALWPEHRAVRDETEALPKAGSADFDGVREIVLVASVKNPQEAEIRRRRLEVEARSRGVEGRVIIRISEQRIAA